MTDNLLTLYLEGRIDSNNAFKVEEESLIEVKKHPNADLALDAKYLEYISSAGLRVLMKLRKIAKKTLPMYNASPAVYEILDVTGFVELLDVHKALREVSVEGCELIGSGGYGKVYRIDPETIVKVYNPEVTLDMVRRERDVSQKAFLAGVPTAISFDVVRCGDSYGVVYELLNAHTVAQVMDADRDRVVEMGTKSGKFLKHLHTIEMAEGALPNRKEEMLNWLTNVESFLEPSEVEEIRSFIQAVPDRSTFLHGDFNSKNVMVQQDGEFILIDIGDSAIGHPVFDVASLILPYLYLPKSQMPDEEKYRLLGFHLEDAPTMWTAISSAYFDLKDPEDTKLVVQKYMPYAQLLSSYHGSRRANYNPDYMQKGFLVGIRQRLLPLVRQAKPL
jgi:uncharacterized protein (TIGR02172 family)